MTSSATAGPDGTPTLTVNTTYEAVPAGFKVTTYSGTGPVAGNGTTLTTVTDLLGRVISSTDAWGTVTATTYTAQAGRVSQVTTTPPGGTATALKFGYDDDGKVLSVKDEADVTLATVGYDADEQLLVVGYGSSGNSLDTVLRDAAGRVIGNDWTVGGESITDAVVRSRSGRVVQHTTTRGSLAHTSTYGYDAAGRLVSAAIPGHVLTYGFAASGGCGVNASAGKSGNRTSFTDAYTVPGGSTSVSSTQYCYDWADRLTSTAVTNPVTGANTVTDGLAPADIGYDVRGNTTRLADMTFSYDAANRHVGTVYDDGSMVAYVRDVAGRVIQSTIDPAGAPPAVETRYLYAGGTDVAWGQTTGGVVTRSIPLPGGATTTVAASGTTWSFPNLQGHTMLTRTGTTSSAGIMLWDPYGQPLDPTTLAIGTNQADDTGQIAGNTGWHHGALKQTATVGSTAVIEMGARLYVPALGRFLQVDPIEGGVDNDYVWPTDPIGLADISGRYAIPLVPAIAIVAILLIVAAVILGQYPVSLPPVRISMPSWDSPDWTMEKRNSRDRRALGPLAGKTDPRGSTYGGNQDGPPPNRNTGRVYTTEAAAREAAIRYTQKRPNTRCFRDMCAKGNHVHVDVIVRGRPVGTHHYYWE